MLGSSGLHAYRHRLLNAARLQPLDRLPDEGGRSLGLCARVTPIVVEPRFDGQLSLGSGFAPPDARRMGSGRAPLPHRLVVEIAYAP